MGRSRSANFIQLLRSRWQVAPLLSKSTVVISQQIIFVLTTAHFQIYFLDTRL